MNNMILEGKVALVTGAGHGIGKGCAVELARAGADLVINDRPESADLDTTAEEIRALGRRCAAVRLDAFDRAAPEKLVGEAVKAVGKIDIFVSNPAFDIAGYVTTLAPDNLREVLDHALVSHFAMAQAVAKKMIERGEGGKIIFMASVYGRLNRKKHVGYDTAKAGVEQMMRVFARELAEHRITVNAIAPGFTNTPGERKDKDENKIKEIADGLPFGRGATPEEIGEAAVYFASAEYTTGSVLVVDGGMSLVDYTYSKAERK